MTEETRRYRLVYEAGHFSWLRESSIKGINAVISVSPSQLVKYVNEQLQKEGKYLPPKTEQ